MPAPQAGRAGKRQIVIVKVVEPEVRPLDVALIVIDPTLVAFTLFDAVPLALDAVPRPLTVPVPETFANVTETFGDGTTFPAASWTWAVSARD